MRRRQTFILIAVAATILTLAVVTIAEKRSMVSDQMPSSIAVVPGPRNPATSRGQDVSLYCEFNNFADLTPLVGFLFRIERTRSSPTFSLIFQRDQDGSQIDFGSENKPSPHWTFDTTDTQPVIHSPEDDLRINLYGYDPEKSGHAWFEAGLRSIRYKNLGGRCRQGA